MKKKRFEDGLRFVLLAFCLQFSIFNFQSSMIYAQRLVVEKPVVECGRTGYLQPVTATFELKNKGRKLTIESVRPDCGCTAVEYPREVASGDKFTIKMTYDARQLGRFQKSAAVIAKGSAKPVYLTMRGVVLTEVQDYTGSYPLSMGALLLDQDVLEFDDVNKGDTPVQEIHILNNGTDRMQPRLMHLPPYLDAIVKPESLEPGKSGKITVTLVSDKLRDYGLTKTQVYLAQHLGDKVSADKAIDVSVTLLPDLSQFEGVSRAQAPQLQITETDLDFTDFGGKDKKTVDVELTNTGASTLVISSMQMYTGGLKVTLGKQQIEPGQSTTLKIVGFAEELAKVKSRPRILMITNDPDHPKLTINIKVK